MLCEVNEMFTMYKNTLRTIIKSKSQTIVVVLLLVFVGLYFSLFFNSIMPVYVQYENQKKTSNIEDFRFYPAIGINESENETVEELSQKYDFDYSIYNHKNIVSNSVMWSITDYTGTIDKNIFYKGENPENSSELGLGVGYAKANGIDVGDSIRIEGKSYFVSGLFYDLGNTYVYDSILSSSVFVKDNAKVLVTQGEYESFDYDNNVIYLARFTDNRELETKVQGLIESEDFIYVLSSAAIPDVTMFGVTLSSQLIMMCFGSILIFVITTVFIAIFIGTHMKKSKKQFGIMLAMGYKRSNVILSYIYFPVLFFVLIGIGTIVGFYCKSIVTKQLEIGFNYPIDLAGIQLPQMLCFSAIYAVLLGAVMMLFVRKSLNKKPLDLLLNRKANVVINACGTLRTVLNKLPFRQHIKYAFASSRIGRLFAMTFCITISVLLLNSAFALYMGYNNGVKNFEEKTDFNEVINYKDVQELGDSEAYESKFLKVSAFLSKIGNETVNKTIDVEFVDFKHLPIDFGVDTSKMGLIAPIRYKYVNGASVGDTVIIKGKSRVLKQEIIGFSELSVNSTFYINHSVVDELDDVYDTGSFNGEYSSVGGIVPDDSQSVTTKESMIEQIKELQQSSSSIVIMLVIFSIFATFFMVNIMSGVNVADNIHGIMIMLMSGYKKKTVSSLLLNIYVIAVCVGIIIAIVLLPYVLTMLTVALNTTDAGFIGMTFNLTMVLASVAIILLIYYSSLFAAQNRYLKLDVKAVMSEE
jgi:putative ABC transport system permease protein